MLMTNSAFDHTMPRPPHHSLYQSNHTGSKIGSHSKLGHNSNLNNTSALGNSSLNFYPHLLQPTRMSGVLGAGSSNSSSNRAPSTRTSLKYSASQSTAKNVSFYRSGDVHMQAFKVAITRRNFRTFDSLLESLSDRIPLPFGVRTISTPSGTHGINRLDEFEDGKAYVCSDKKTVKPLNLKAVQHSRPPWFISKPKTRTRAVAQLIRRPDAESYRVPLRLTQVKTPKKIVIVRNGEPNFRHSILLSRRTPQGFESILEDIGEIFRMRVQKLYTTDGRKVESLQSLFLGPNVYIAAGREAFQPMEYKVKRVAIIEEKNEINDVQSQLNKERTPKELKKSKGRWRVTVTTSELAAAGTDSHVTIIVYGTKGNSGSILLNDGNDAIFRSGNEDEFAINVGAIGEIRKVRIAHDNSGTSPGWLCESINLTDVTTGEILNFPCNRWLSRDEDDGEICREISARWIDKPVLPDITYLVAVTTGNLWNAGTDASVQITLFGDLGDSGPRLLQHGGKAKHQVKGATEVYRIGAVSLGVLHRVVIGHESTEKGAGWFLERIVVREDRVGSDEWVFPCDRWLDAGEDDGKVVRELYAENESKSYSRSRNQADKNKIDLLWELEKWKFQRGNHVVLLSQATEKALRVRSDAGIDGLGDPSLPTSTFEVLRRRGNVRVFSNVGQSSFHIALDQNRMLGHGKGGTFCEFYVKIQPDRSVVLESCKYPGQHATVDPSGKSADTRGHPNVPGRLFSVYVKGCFRHDSVILLNTSPMQALAITSVGDVIGTGRRADTERDDVSVTTGSTKEFVHFRIVKIAEGVRMFRCVKDPGRYLRIKDGQCDGWGNGDVYCHFKIHKYKLGCYVTLQSMKHRGVFIGLNTNGKARPTVDTGEENTQFYPQVISFGERRKNLAEEWTTPEPSFVISNYDDIKPPSHREASPAKSKLSVTSVTLHGRERSDTGPRDGDFRVYVTTGNSGTMETIALQVFGDKINSGAITLGKGAGGGVFQCGQTDEFQVNLPSIGEIRKIRIGIEEVTSQCDWRLKQVKMKDMNTNEIFRFKFNRWISRTRDDGATLRELPVLTQDGNPVLPVHRYYVLVRTSKDSARLKPNKDDMIGTQHEIYLCLHGDNGDTGRRLLLRKPVEFPDDADVVPKPLFAPGQLDRFEIEAVSLGELTRAVISCPKTSSEMTSLAWLCDEIIVRQSEGANSEFVFQCKNKWLGTSKVGAKAQIKLELTEKREVKKKSSDGGGYKDGDWKVSVTTGSLSDSGTSSNVMFHACGSDMTSSGAVFLGSGSKGLFAAGTTEQFKVNLAGVNDLHKIRLSHDNSGQHPPWYVERIKLKCVSNDVTYTLDVRKWLSLDEDPHQLFLEVPIPKPGKELSKVLRYQVLIYTGSILGSDTDANVFISVFGEKGDTGRRPLHKSLNNDVKFQESQVDIFQVDAVDLGELTRIEIGHDGIGHGNGWFLHKVIIKESHLSPRDYIFFCNRWLDDGQDDGKIERIIHVEPLDENEDHNHTSEGKYKVYVATGANSSSQQCPTDADITMVIYGEEGKTGQILLQPDRALNNDDVIQCFKPGQTDEFQIEVPEIGSIYKIRLSLNEKCDWSGWFVEELILEDSVTKQQLLFHCKRWLSNIEDDQETVREFAVTREDEEPLPVHSYYVSVTTGDRPAASTDANVFMTLRGERGDTGRRKLTQANGNVFPFQRNTTSSFTIEAVDLGKLHEVVISHDGQGYGSGWFLETVTVRENEFATVEWVFPGHVWLDDHVGDCKTVRRLRLLGSCDVIGSEDELIKLAVPPSRGTPDNGGLYDVTVVIDELMTEGNEAVRLNGVVQGNRGLSEVFSLGEWVPGGEKEHNERVDVGKIGEINKIRVEMEDSLRDFNLFLLTVTFQNVHTKELLSFHFNRRFKTETGSTTKELPALRSNKPHAKLVSYLIYVEMSPSNSEIASQGKLQLKLAGTNGDSGFRTLFRGLNGLCATKRDKGYVFEHEAVDLGQLTNVTLAYVTNDVSDDESGWEISDVIIRVTEPPNSYAGLHRSDPTYQTSVNHKFGSTSMSHHVFPLEACEPEAEMQELFRVMSGIRGNKPVKSPALVSEGSWRLYVTTSTYDQNSIFNHVSALILGTRGTSDVITIEATDADDDDVIEHKRDEKLVRTADLQFGRNLGEIYQIRITLNKDSTVRIYKVKLKDLTTNQEYLSFITASERLNTSANEDGVIQYNIPLLKPDQNELKHHKYELKITTGDFPAAGTDADVKLNVVGTNGETGPRSLAALVQDPDSLFQAGQTDNVTMETVDVGEPRKVIIGHTERGGGAGWFLNDVIIKETRDDRRCEFMFPCYKWLDDSVDDKLIQREIYVMGTRLHQPDVDVSKSKGNWKWRVKAIPDVMKEQNIDVKFTLCMDGDQSRDIIRSMNEEVDIFDLNLDDSDAQSPSNAVMTSEFLKLRAHIEGTNDVTSKQWPLEQCWMRDQDTGEEIRFVFDSAPVWEGSARGHVRELPVIRHIDSYAPVIDYYVIFYTSSQSHRDFAPSSVSCQLHGKHGSTGWRNIVSNNSSGKFQPGRVDVFTVEAVTLNDVIDYVSICVTGPLTQPWKLDRIKVKRGYYDNVEQVFECDREIFEDEAVQFSQYKTIKTYPKVKSALMGANSKSTQIKYSLELVWTGLNSILKSSGSDESGSGAKTTVSSVSVQLSGDKGCSDVTSVELNEAVLESNGKYRNEIGLMVDSSALGQLVKVGVGVLEPASPTNISSQCKLRKVSLRNQNTHQYYSFRPDHSFFDQPISADDRKQTGSNWLELVATRPRQDPSSIAKVFNYVILLGTSGHDDAGTDAHVYVTLIGSKGDSGKRWLMTSSSGNDATHRPGEEEEFEISSVDLGPLNQVIIGHDGRDVTSGWHLDNVTVTSSSEPEKQFVFVCKKWLANLQEDTFIERTLNLDHVNNLDDVTEQ